VLPHVPHVPATAHYPCALGPQAVLCVGVHSTRATAAPRGPRAGAYASRASEAPRDLFASGPSSLSSSPSRPGPSTGFTVDTKMKTRACACACHGACTVAARVSHLIVCSSELGRGDGEVRPRELV
jgi:hypothetical protein